jgi:hypothetical protein
MQVLNAVSLHGGLTASWPVPAPVTARFTVAALTAHWRAIGLPRYAQFDNDSIFRGTHNSAVALGRVIRLCLSLGVTPVFVPPGEVGFQAMVEGYNGWWQAKVWSRFPHTSVAEVQMHSQRYVAAVRSLRSGRIEAAPARRSFPTNWKLDLWAAPRGRIVFLRRTNVHGDVSLLGQTWRVSPLRGRHLVRVDVDLAQDRIRFYALSRNSPLDQPLLVEAHFQLPERPFQGDS